jgi:hypothetical protein
MELPPQFQQFRNYPIYYFIADNVPEKVFILAHVKSSFKQKLEIAVENVDELKNPHPIVIIGMKAEGMLLEGSARVKVGKKG